MDAGTAMLLGVATLFALNRLVLALPDWTERRALFWLLQGLNLAGASVLVLVRLPGLTGAAAWMGRVLAVLLVLHNLQASQLYLRARRARLALPDPAQQQRREEIQRALAAGRPAEEPTEPV